MKALALLLPLVVITAFSTSSYALLAAPTLIVARLFNKTSLILGLLVPLIPLLDPHALPLLALLYLLLHRHEVSLSWMSPLLLVLLSWSFAALYWEFDLKAVSHILAEKQSLFEQLKSIRNIVLISPPHFISVLQVVITWVIIGGCTSSFAASTRRRGEVVRGLVGGSLISLLITSYTLWSSIHCLHNAQSSFWSSLSRYCSTFSDPNAFGVAVSLLLPLILSHLPCFDRRLRVLGQALLLPLVVVGLYSGSRTFVLSIALYGLIAVWLWSKRAVVGVVVLGAVVILCINLTPVHLESLPLPSSLMRTLQSVSLGTLTQAFFSRSLFWTLGLDVWRDYPLFGSGPETFRNLLPVYLEERRVDIGGWSDNANSFYLGLLAEMGIVGAVALILSLTQLRLNRLRSQEARWAGIGVGVFAITLLLGPHLEFPEVAILFSLLLGQATTPRPYIPHRSYLLFAPAIALLVGWRSTFLEYGLHRWEKSAQGTYRWSTHRAFGRLPCVESKGVLRLSTSDPRAASLPVKVTIIVREETHEVTLRPGQVKKVGLSCEGGDVWYRLDVSRVWLPSEQGLGPDSRILGVQVYSPMTSVR